MKRKINIAIVGVGNCVSSVLQGLDALILSTSRSTKKGSLGEGRAIRCIVNSPQWFGGTL